MGIQLQEGESIIKEGPANHVKGLESVGGYLWLTNRRLFFKSHAINIQVHEESFPLEAIASVRATNLLMMVPTGLEVAMQNGKKEQFVVFAHNDWVKKILAAQQQLAAPRIVNPVAPIPPLSAAPSAAANPASRFCPQCGAPLAAGTRFCEQCGHPL